VTLLPLWIKRVASLVKNLPSDALASLAQKSRQFSRNLPSDEAHLFGSIEELGTPKKKKKTTFHQKQKN